MQIMMAAGTEHQQERLSLMKRDLFSSLLIDKRVDLEIVEPFLFSTEFASCFSGTFDPLCPDMVSIEEPERGTWAR